MLRIVFNDPTFSLQLLRAIGETYYKGADIGECLSTAYRIKEGDFESWHEEWLKTAERIYNYAEECILRGHKISAREAYLRASNYYRISEFMLIDPKDPRINITWRKSKESFRKALEFFPHHVESVEIPYEKGISLPGYFYYYDSKKNITSHSKQNKKGHFGTALNINNKYDKVTEFLSPQKPTIIVHGGFDSTLEELYFGIAAPALDRGYNCLTFEGPGQGGVIRKQKIPFRHDWEKVVTPVIDFIYGKKDEYEIDTDKLALIGISMGGYLAARAAAFDDRISACILYNGVYNGYEAIASAFSQDLIKALEKADKDYVNSTLFKLMRQDPNVKFNLKHGMWTTDSSSPYELIIKAKQYATQDILSNIRCDVLVLEAEKDDSFPGQPKKVYDGLISARSKKYIIFTEEEGAEEHCQCGASALTNQRIFDWLDEKFYNSNPKI